MPNSTCAHPDCVNIMPADLPSSRKYCSELCRLAPNGPTCAGCGKRMHRGKGVAPQGKARCMKCRNGEKGYYLPADGRRLSHGESAYRGGCRCRVCVEANSASSRKYLDNHSAKHGVHYSTTWRRAFKDEHGYWPASSSREWIPQSVRSEVYERDAWVCQLCFEPVDAFADEFRLRPSLDHIEPVSTQLVPDHSVSNLQLAHVGCNAKRRNKPLEEVLNGR